MANKILPSRRADTSKNKAIEQFVPDAMKYLDRVLGDNTAFYGKEAVAATIRYGVERAGAYGIVGRRDVCFYLPLMFSLMGSDFDQDPLYPWAADILKSSFLPPNDKLARLLGGSNELLKDIRQREPQYFKNVLAVTRSNVFTELPDTAGASRIGERVSAEIKRRFPGKVACVGEDNVRRLVAQGLDDARAQGLQRGPDIAAFIQFMFIYGVRFYSDPKYPQAHLIFSASGATGTEKIAAMFAETRQFLLRKVSLLKA